MNRFAYLAEGLARSGHLVTFVTSAFSHTTKSFRAAPQVTPNNMIIRLVPERGYRSHLGVGRILSIKSFAENFKRMFSSFDEYDIVYSAYPLISHNLYIAARRSKRTKFVIDIQDIWPESIRSAIPWVRHIPKKWLPFTRAANKVYGSADCVVAVSSTYLARAMEVRSNLCNIVAYIGSEFTVVPNQPSRGGNLSLFYIGAITYSYDLATVIAAVSILARQGRPVEFHVYGGGPWLSKLKAGDTAGTIFHGLLSYRELERQLRGHHVAVNCISKSAAQTVTNKLCDYLVLGCPILSSQECEEVRQIVAERVSASYTGGDVESAVYAIEQLLVDGRIRDTWKPDLRFSREASFRVIENLIGTVSDKAEPC